MTDGTVTFDNVNATFNDYVVTLKKSRQDENCAEFNFTLSAVNIESENLETYTVTKGYEQGKSAIKLMFRIIVSFVYIAPEDFDSESISTTVLFFANTTPIIRIKAQV